MRTLRALLTFTILPLLLAFGSAPVDDRLQAIMAKLNVAK